MTIKIGQIPYLNSEVFYYALDGADFELAPMVPSALSRAAAAGAIDAGPVPTVACFELEETYEPLGGFCIATVEKARSLFLYSQRPIEKLAGAVIGVTSETTTTGKLLDVLLKQRFHIRDPLYGPLAQDREAFLLIGDEALKYRYGVSGYPYQYDLGQVWNQWTGLPFVFAQWVVRKGLDPEAVERLRTALDRSVEQGLAGIEDIGRIHRDLGMTMPEIRQYIEGFRYRMGPEELKAMQRFRTMLAGARPVTT